MVAPSHTVQAVMCTVYEGHLAKTNAVLTQHDVQFLLKMFLEMCCNASYNIFQSLYISESRLVFREYTIHSSENDHKVESHFSTTTSTKTELYNLHGGFI